MNDGTSSAGETSTSAAIETSTDTTDGSSSEASSGSSGEVPEGCYDGIVVAGELCFEYRGVSYGQDATAVATGDFDADGNPDALVGSYWPAQIFYGSGDGTFYAVRSLYASGQAAGAAVTDAAAIDLNQDGFDDAILSYRDSDTVDVFLSYEGGTFAAAQSYSVGGGPNQMRVADVDDDGFYDIVTANATSSEVAVLYGYGDGTLELHAPIASGAEPNSVAIGDLDANGLTDIIVGASADLRVDVFLNQGNQMFAGPVTLGLQRVPVTVLLSDLDGDGQPDLFVSTLTQENFVLYGLPGGVFAEEIDWWNWTGRTAFSAAPGDFNADGIVDIAWAEGFMGNGGMTWMLGQGGRLFETELNPLYTFPVDLAVADFNHDGVDDVVLANSMSPIGLGLLLSVP